MRVVIVLILSETHSQSPAPQPLKNGVNSNGEMGRNAPHGCSCSVPKVLTSSGPVRKKENTGNRVECEASFCLNQFPAAPRQVT